MSALFLLPILLIGCQNEADPVKVDKVQEVEKQEEVLAVSAEDNLIEYEWKTNYAFIVEQYITSYGFLNLDINPFDESSTGVVATKVLYDKGREVPYLAILYAASDGVLTTPTFKHEELQVDEGVYLDIWDFQNGEAVHLERQIHNNQGEAGDLAVAIVETASDETLLRFTSETETGDFYSYTEDFYAVSNLEKPLYHLANNISKSEDGTGKSRFFVNEEVSENEYLEQRKQLNHREHPWIDSNFGSKSISDETGPIIANVVAVFDFLDTQQLQAPTAVLPIEEQVIFNKLLSFEIFEDQLTNDKKIEFANAINAIRGGTYSEDSQQLAYPKEAIDYYSESNFDFILDETKFPSKLVERTPAYQDGNYIYPVLGDYGLLLEIYVVDLLQIEKVEDTLYKVQFDEFYFDPFLHEESGFESIDSKYFNLPKSQWPKDTYEFMLNKQTKYAVFKKNKYGFALVERSLAPNDEKSENAEADSASSEASTQNNIEPTPVQSSSNSQEKEQYLESLDYAYKLYDEMYSGASLIQPITETYDVWDYELNKIYGMLREKLSPAEMEQLKQEQRAWIKIRDNEVGKPEEIGLLTYWEILLDKTMDRTNYLINLYFDEAEK